MKILVLGASGMLGSMVYHYFKDHTNHETKGTVRDKSLAIDNNFFIYNAEKDDINEVVFNNFKPDYIINAIGIIKPYCKDDDPEGVVRAIRINALFPSELANSAEQIGAKVIQIATDCVYDGFGGNYKEKDPHNALDVYGKSKSLGEIDHPNILHIRASIIGPEKKGNLNLMEWILGNQTGAELKGFDHHKWNGVTTLQFAKLCEQIVNGGKNYFGKLRNTNPVLHYLPNETVTKYELLHIFNDLYNKEFKIEKVSDMGPAIDRSLDTDYDLFPEKKSSINMNQAIQELKDFIETNKYY